MTAPSGRFVIAIDGPSGTGKSTVARLVAEALGAGYLDTGAMYRIVTLAVLRDALDPVDDAAVAAALTALVLDPPTDPLAQRQLLRGDDVTTEIRSSAVTSAVSPVSANPAVRAWLKDRQQAIARSGRMVVEGRDIGTVIAPDAELKVYLTASAEVRARRRHDEGRTDVAGRDPGELAAVQAALAHRDRYDSTRVHAPLAAADDAVVVDTSGLDIHESVRAVLALAAERGIS